MNTKSIPKRPDPSEAEIAAACEAIQARWSEGERKARTLWTVERSRSEGRYTICHDSSPLPWVLTRPSQAEIEELTVPEISLR